MAQITLGGNPISTVGELPAIGSPAPEFTLTGTDLEAVNSEQFRGKSLLPTRDTSAVTSSNLVRPVHMALNSALAIELAAGQDRLGRAISLVRGSVRR
jgi:hypothetical protein